MLMRESAHQSCHLFRSCDCKYDLCACPCCWRFDWEMPWCGISTFHRKEFQIGGTLITLLFHLIGGYRKLQKHNQILLQLIDHSPMFKGIKSICSINLQTSVYRDTSLGLGPGRTGMLCFKAWGRPPSEMKEIRVIHVTRDNIKASISPPPAQYQTALSRVARGRRWLCEPLSITCNVGIAQNICNTAPTVVQPVTEHLSRATVARIAIKPILVEPS